ncbi:MAG: circadian clock KaiC-like protein [Thermoprotei archaeon]|nr:MAG: circadian clock KaiC-like protein [Thermoprotei archaeon]
MSLMSYKNINKKCPTGIKELDHILGGGFDRGSIVLLAGHPGAGKSTFAAQFVYKGASEYGEPGVYVSFSESKKEFYEHMKAFGFDFDKLEKKNIFKFLSMISIADEKIVGSIINNIYGAVEEIRAKRLVIDSITSMLEAFTLKEARAFLHANVLLGLKPYGITTLLIADLPWGKETIGHGFEEFLADAIIVLKLDEKRGLTRRILEIRKNRGAPTPRVSYDFVITNEGIKLYVPLEASLSGGFTKERAPTGIPELDEMLGGGILKGSVVLISGPSGTGKTLISLNFAIEGARRGERVVYISFEEPRNQLKTAIRNMGVNLEELEKYLYIYSLSPRLFTPAALYSFYDKLLEKHKPSRVVIDGAYALARHYEEEEYLELIRNISLLSKAHRVTLVVTALSNIISLEEVGISTIADVLIALWFDISGGYIRKKIAILKQRGSWHDARQKELVIEDGKVKII